MKAALTASFTPVRTDLVQRKCACDGSTAFTSECADCSKTRQVVQRHAGNQKDPAEVPSIVYDVLRSLGQPLDHVTRAFFGGLELRGRRIKGSGVVSDGRVLNVAALYFDKLVLLDPVGARHSGSRRS